MLRDIHLQKNLNYGLVFLACAWKTIVSSLEFKVLGGSSSEVVVMVINSCTLFVNHGYESRRKYM